MKIYIRSSACISAQRTFETGDFLTEPITYNDTRLKAIEPGYTTYIDPKLIRRMSHVIKMGVSAAKNCLDQAGITMPGAIITGSALGCVADTVTFLSRMIEMNEEMLPPTSFIQSTHNTVAAQVALALKCHNYNSTFVHKGISFESAVTDALMLLNEGEADNVLVGGIDELTDTSFKVFSRLGMIKRQPVNNLEIFDNPSKGTLAGEGTAFFLLTDKPSPVNMAQLNGVQTFYKLKDAKAIGEKIAGFLARRGLTIDDIDLVINGENGDIRNDAIYHELNNSYFKDASLARYKHLSGDYAVSSSFALWLAANIVKRGEVPEVIKQREIKQEAPKKVLICNHYLNTYYSVMLVSAC